jgi:hypothetical protein
VSVKFGSAVASGDIVVIAMLSGPSVYVKLYPENHGEQGGMGGRGDDEEEGGRWDGKTGEEQAGLFASQLATAAKVPIERKVRTVSPLGLLTILTRASGGENGLGGHPQHLRVEPRQELRHQGGRGGGHRGARARSHARAAQVHDVLRGGGYEVRIAEATAR